MIPVAGPVREGVGLLGSPCFEIPRSVQRRPPVRPPQHRAPTAPPLKAKNRHNAATIGLYLLVRWLYLTGIVLVALLPLRAAPGSRCAVTSCSGSAGSGSAASPCTLRGDLLADALRHRPHPSCSCWPSPSATSSLVERAVTGFRALRPRFCSIYQPPFWRHERFWKVPSIAYIQMFNGTPFKSVVWRLLGRADRPPGLRRRLLDRRADPGQGRRRGHAQRREHPAGPFPGRRRLQVRPHRHRRQVHRSAPAPSSTTASPGRRRRARRRFLPDEGRARPAGLAWLGNPATEASSAAPPGTVTGPAAGRGVFTGQHRRPARRLSLRPPVSTPRVGPRPRPPSNRT